ncbi:MAG TPA: hypothetical protein GX693_00700, partial [Firmicutes bacterium]|nr:hypothetical protein [Bacillota bacterium]
VIVDYKTDNVPWPQLEERLQRYRAQGLIYALALQEITGLPVKEFVFLFVRKKSARLLDLQNLRCQAEELLKTLLE